MQPNLASADEMRMISEALQTIHADVRNDYAGAAYVKMVELRTSDREYGHKLRSIVACLKNLYRTDSSGYVNRNAYGRSKRNPQGINTIPLSQSHPAEINRIAATENNADCQLVREDILRELPQELRAIAVLLEDGYNFTEVAKKIGITRQTVKTRVVEMREIITKRLAA